MKKYAAYTELYVHIIWSTWDRLSLITPVIESRLYAAILAKCLQLNCIPLAIGGVSDHVHLLVRLHAPVSVSELVKGVKGATSHLVTHELTPGEFFKWQGSYSAFSVSPESLTRLKTYIANQKRHHDDHDLMSEEEILSSDGEDSMGGPC